MLGKFLCLIGRHSYAVRRNLGDGARKVCCLRCKRCWAMHDGTRSFLPWDSDFEQFYKQTDT